MDKNNIEARLANFSCQQDGLECWILRNENLQYSILYTILIFNITIQDNYVVEGYVYVYL